MILREFLVRWHTSLPVLAVPFKLGFETLEKLLTCDLQPFASTFSFPETTSDFRASQVM